MENEPYNLCLFFLTRDAKLEERKKINAKKINSQEQRKGHLLFVISQFALEYFFFHGIYFSLASACEKR